MKSKVWRCAGIIAGLFLLLVIPALAQQNVTVTLVPDKEILTVGDVLNLRIEVQHPTGYQVIFPTLEQTWGADDSTATFEVREQSQAETTKNDDGSETTSQSLAVTLFAPGVYQTPPFPVTVRGEEDEVFEVLATPISLTVGSVLIEGDAELRDIKPQASLPVPPVWPWAVLGALVASMLTWQGWRWYQRWRRGRARVSPQEIDLRPPHQVAYEELERIEGLGLLSQGKYKEHYTLVTDCLRLYLERQFNLHVFERTTAELRLILRASVLAPDVAKRFLDLFSESDLVKFAKLRPEMQVAESLVDHARALIEVTRPKQVEASDKGEVE